MNRLLALMCAASLLAAACGNDDATSEGTGDATSSSAVSDGASATTATSEDSTTTSADVPAPAASLAEVALTERSVVQLLAPIDFATHPVTGEVWVAQREGRIVALEGPDQLLDISTETTTDGERGLLGIAFNATGDRLYISFTDLDGNSQLDELSLDGQTLDIGERRNLSSVEQPFANHNGGGVQVGPDGLVYWGLGDGGSRDDPEMNGQDTSTLLGSLVRIDPSADDLEPEIYQHGLRNPFRFSFDDDELWIGDVGQNKTEEIDFWRLDDGPGTNWGWPAYEGNDRYLGPDAPDHEPPVFTYDHDEGCSITGGLVVRGEAVPQLAGVYLFTDLCNPEIRALRLGDDDEVADEATVLESSGGIVAFGQGLDGRLFIADLTGNEVREILPS